MDATHYRPEVPAQDDRAEDICETETTRVFRHTDPRTARHLNLIAQATGKAAGAFPTKTR